MCLKCPTRCSWEIQSGVLFKPIPRHSRALTVSDLSPLWNGHVIKLQPYIFPLFGFVNTYDGWAIYSLHSRTGIRWETCVAPPDPVRRRSAGKQSYKPSNICYAVPVVRSWPSDGSLDGNLHSNTHRVQSSWFVSHIFCIHLRASGFWQFTIPSQHAFENVRKIFCPLIISRPQTGE